MDQDSNFDKSMIELYIKKFEEMKMKNSSIAIFAPKTSNNERYGYVDRVITSGNILNLEAYKLLNGFDDNLFIDEVDFDLCFKACEAGYKIYKFEDIILNHKLGNSKKVKILIKEFTCMNHQYIRKYYIIRNRCIVKNRYPNYTKHYTIYNVIDLVKVILGEEDKLRRIRYMIKGYVDYKKNNLGKLNIK